MRKSKVYQVSNEEFIALVKSSSNYSECLRKLGLSTNGGSSLDVLKRRIQELNCSVNHFEYHKSSNAGIKTPLKVILVENSSYTNTNALKKRLIKEGLVENKCSICGQLPIWNNQPLVLQLDHINGNNRDNRIENLRLVCPNCHSQTGTYSGKNKQL